MSLTRKKMLWSILVGATSLCAVFGVLGSRNIGFKTRSAVATSNQLPVLRGPVLNVRFTVYDAGIFPRQQHAKPGNVAISIEDRTHRSSGLVVQALDTDAPITIGQVTPVFERARGRAQFSLGAGHYAVFDSSQPRNRAELIIEP